MTSPFKTKVAPKQNGELLFFLFFVFKSQANTILVHDVCIQITFLTVKLLNYFPFSVLYNILLLFYYI